MSRLPSKVTRRKFFRQTIGSGIAASLAAPLSSRPVATVGTAHSESNGIVIRADKPAGPPPLGAPVETAVPFPRGQLSGRGEWTVVAPNGQPVITQVRPTAHWDDGSVRWLSVVFEAEAGPGNYALRKGPPPEAADLVRSDNETLILDNDELVLMIPRCGSRWMESWAARDAAGTAQNVVSAAQLADLLLTRHDGKLFRASLAGGTLRVVLEERGPMRVAARLEGKCRAEDGEALFDFILRLVVYRGRPEVAVTVTWINCTDKPSEQVRDVRLTFPFEFEPNRLVLGCETGVYDGPYLKDWPVYILQEDHNQYWAKTRNPDGRIQNLASGGCNGERAPGWLYVQNASRCLGLWVPNFWQEYPNEISLEPGKLSLGLWPERAVHHLLSKPLLAAHPEGQGRYSMTRYWPIMPHPYQAFVDPQNKCLDVRQGLAKTQEVVVSLWAGRGAGPSFERKWWSQTLKPVRGHLNPNYVASTGALGPLAPRETGGFRRLEEQFEEAFGWLNRHIDQRKCYGKFDYGDFKYFTASTTYLCHPGTKWGEMGEMAREGYWHNNERDTFLGLLLYYYRTADGTAWERSRIVARHLLDVDIRHYPHWGMWTHSYGHCYVALGEGGEPDHSWLLGLLVWAGVSGDPLAWDWVARCGERLVRLKIDFTRADARTAALFLHMMCQFYRYTGKQQYLEAAQPAVAAFLEFQNTNGSWPAYMGDMERSRIEGFVEHAVMALADYYAICREKPVRQALDRAIAYLFGDGKDFKVDGETPLALFGLAVLAEEAPEKRYAELARSALEKLRRAQNRSPDPIGRGDMMAEWGVNNPETAKDTGRPAQFLGQTRPLTPSAILAYGQPAMAAVSRRLRPDRQS